MDSKVLKEAGIDLERGVARFLGDRQLYESILLNFLVDKTFANAKEAMEEENYKDLYECVHTLKGVAANTDMTILYRTTGELCDYLRKQEAPDKEKTTLLFCQMEEAYYSVMKGIVAARGA
ncbi:Hpt domain-containing protein [Anaerotignum sp.]|uniref:Hpt domain-containing protein n=1 Tax=Anaerotignum sp. TaxID=2039241 RepID=UPI002714A7D6|nr:Hpt domain-containing protein [Anaerotignum sp.]